MFEVEIYIDTIHRYAGDVREEGNGTSSVGTGLSKSVDFSGRLPMTRHLPKALGLTSAELMALRPSPTTVCP